LWINIFTCVICWFFLLLRTDFFFFFKEDFHQMLSGYSDFQAINPLKKPALMRPQIDSSV
jgi:hypothetical protein